MCEIGVARSSHEEVVEAGKDMVFVAGAMHAAGADGINFDTTGAADDPDSLAALRATEILKRKYPGICIEGAWRMSSFLECTAGSAIKTPDLRALFPPAGEAGRRGQGQHIRPGGEHKREQAVPMESFPDCQPHQGLLRGANHRRARNVC
jgi:hypothetical protein